jgi:hypothetical protein
LETKRAVPKEIRSILYSINVKEVLKNMSMMSMSKSDVVLGFIRTRLACVQRLTVSEGIICQINFKQSSA